MSNPQNLKNSSDLLKLVRLERSSFLDESTKDTIRNELLTNYLGDGSTSDIQSNDINLDLKVRQLIQVDGKWSEIRNLLTQKFLSEKSEKSAIKLIETAYVMSNENEVMACFEEVLAITNSYNFYWNLHPKLREFIVDHSPTDLLSSINSILVKEKDESRLTPVEKLLIFTNLFESKNKNYAWVFWQRNKTCLSNVCKKTTHIDISHDNLNFKLFQLAVKLNHIEEAKSIIQEMDIGSIERSQAVQILLDAQSKPLRKTENSLLSRLQSVKSSVEALECIKATFLMYRNSNFTRDDLNQDLNEFLDAPEKYSQSNNLISWSDLSKILVENRDAAGYLSNYLKFYLDRSLIEAVNVSKSIWHPWLEASPHSDLEILLGSIARIVFFGQNSPHQEHLVWEAVELISKIKTHSYSNLFSNFVKCFIQKSTQSKTITHESKLFVNSVLGLILVEKNNFEAGLNEYLKHCNEPHLRVLSKFKQECWNTNQNNLLLRINNRLHISHPYNNEDLYKTLVSAVKCNKSDLIWRTSSVLNARGVLNSQIQQIWKISGESRTTYLPNKLSKQDLSAIFFGMNATSQRIFGALMLLSKRIKHLIELIDDNQTEKQIALLPRNKEEEYICLTLAYSGFNTQDKKVINKTSSEKTHEDIHAVLNIANNDPWIFTAKKILESIAAGGWGFDKEQLHSMVSNVLPHLGAKVHPSMPAKVGRLLSSLAAHERAAWSELSQALESISPREFSENLLNFTLRTAVMIYPSHYSALKTLQNSRVSLDILRSFENFILSDEYSIFRNRKGIDSKVVFPQSLIEKI